MLGSYREKAGCREVPQEARERFEIDQKHSLTRPLLRRVLSSRTKYGTREEFQKQHGVGTTFRGADMPTGTVVLEKMVEEEVQLWEEEHILKRKEAFKLYVACLQPLF